jgi:ribonuclease BN (tRNA processing enzyme)
VQVTVLGSGTAVPAPDRSASGILVRARGEDLLLDLGPGVLARAGAAGVDPVTIRYVLLSHLHSDHVLDLVTLLQAIDSGRERRTSPLTVVGCRGTDRLVWGLLSLFPGIGPDGYRLEILEVADEDFTLGPWVVRSGRTGHTPDSVGYRIEREGRALVYTGDAADCGAIVALARGADLLVCEASHPAGGATPDHLTPDAAGSIAAAAGVGRLLLTHLYPAAAVSDPTAAARRYYSGLIDVAVDGMSIEL